MAVSGVFSFGLTIAVHPAAKAGPTLRVICLEGKRMVSIVLDHPSLSSSEVAF
jgi:hypothetical protein